MKKTVSPWFLVHACRQCSRLVSDYDRRYRMGVCPWCGARPDSSTVVDTVPVVLRRYRRRVFFGLVVVASWAEGRTDADAAILALNGIKLHG